MVLEAFLSVGAANLAAIGLAEVVFRVSGRRRLAGVVGLMALVAGAVVVGFRFGIGAVLGLPAAL